MNTNQETLTKDIFDYLGQWGIPHEQFGKKISYEGYYHWHVIDPSREGIDMKEAIRIIENNQQH